MDFEETSKTELMSASESGNIDKVLEILKNPPAGFDINLCCEEDCLPMSALDYACEAGHLEIVKILAKFGAEVNMSWDRPPINFAFSGGTFEGSSDTWSSHWQVIKFLIEENGVRPDGSNEHESAYTDVFEAMGSYEDNKELVDYITKQQQRWNSSHPEEV